MLFSQYLCVRNNQENPSCTLGEALVSTQRELEDMGYPDLTTVDQRINRPAQAGFFYLAVLFEYCLGKEQYWPRKEKRPPCEWP